MRITPFFPRMIDGLKAAAALWLLACLGGAGASLSAHAAWDPETFPVSTPIEVEEGLTQEFCHTWNPEFVHQGFLCCPEPSKRKTVSSGRRRARKAARLCDPRRNRASYCSEMTEEQKLLMHSGNAPWVEELLKHPGGKPAFNRVQAWCGPNNGFLAYGKPLVPTQENRIQIRSPGRCTNFGADPMIAMLEWLGRKIAKEFPAPKYQQTWLVVGDISAPRGGCLAGAGGRKGHSSHTNGLDADVAFLVANPGKPSPIQLHKTFDPKLNWWVLKNVFENPYACVQRVFLDRKLIAKLDRVAGDDPVWKRSRRVVQHAKGHKNHFHFRLGTRPGPAGCNAPDEEEVDLNGDSLEEDVETESLPSGM